MSSPTPTRPSPPAPGEVLAGKYRVERVIGEGGMGVVVAATHLQLDQLVALKFTTVEAGPAVARFLREAKNAVRLRSEHVAKVTDVGTLESGAPYMVMEYLEGEDLSHVLEARGPLPVADAVGYVVQACEAVAEAHGLGIVHRDLKPHNLFLTTGVTGLPKVKVLDFGISKTADSELALTRTAEIMGTPSYMSPEQLRSARDVDLRADIWALGVILYELLTARLPFEAENLPHLCTLVATEPPTPLATYRTDLPPPLVDAVLRCLERKPDARFPDAGALVAALAPFAPEWASAQTHHIVPRSVPSARAVISATPRSAATDAAWSETELAVPKPRGLASLRVRVALGAVTVLLLAVAGVRLSHHDAPTAGPAVPSSVVAAVAPPPAPPPPATAPPAASSAPPAVTPPPAPVASATPSASTAPPRSRAAPPPRPHPRPATGPSAPPAADDEDFYKDRH